MSEKTYTAAEIKAAFWRQFCGAGELWFPSEEGREEGEYSTTENEWEEFFEKLNNPEGTT